MAVGLAAAEGFGPAKVASPTLRVRALRAVPPGRAGVSLAALLSRASGASATWIPPELCVLQTPPHLRE
jgi:hypothetical protein